MEIKFENPKGSFGSFNLGLREWGSIEFGPESVVFSGKQLTTSPPFVDDVSVELKFSEIVNVERNGTYLRFDVQSWWDPERDSKSFSFRCGTKQRAGEIEALLPRSQTAEFAQLSAARRDLEAVARRWQIASVVVGLMLPLVGFGSTAALIFLRPPEILSAMPDQVRSWFFSYLWHQIQVQSWAFFCLWLVLWDWPFFRLAWRIRQYLRELGSKAIDLSGASLGGFIGLVVPYLLVYAVWMPWELTLDDQDAGQGIGIGIIIGSIVFWGLGLTGWHVGRRVAHQR